MSFDRQKKNELLKFTLDWFSYFEINGTGEELAFIEKKARSGYYCDKLDMCIFIHRMAATICNEKNNEILQFHFEQDAGKIPFEDFEHLTSLAENWSKELKRKIAIDKSIEAIVSHNEAIVMSKDFEYTNDYQEVYDFVLYEQVSE